MRFREAIREDFKRYVSIENPSIFDYFRLAVKNDCFLYMLSFRFTQAIHKIRFKIIKIPAKFIFVSILHRIISTVFGVYIDSGANIGKGLHLGHTGCIYIGRIKMGKYCNISQQVTIGYGGQGSVRGFGVPEIGSRVYIGPGAKIFGIIKIGEGVSVGANAVVSKDIPDGAIVVGNPGRIIGYQEKNPYIHNVPEEDGDAG